MDGAIAIGLPNTNSVHIHVTSELIKQTPSLLGLSVEVRLMLLKYLLVAPEPLSYQPQALADGVSLLQDWDPYDDEQDSDDGDIDDDSDNESDYDGLDCYAQTFREGNDELIRETNHKLPSFLEPGQTRICCWVIGNTKCCKEEDKEKNKCHIAVLATCRQIYKEGQDLIYHNTIEVTYFTDDFYSTDRRSYVLGQSSVAAALARYPSCKKVKQWVFSIWCESREGILDADVDFETWAAPVTRDVTALQAIGKLKYLELNVNLLKPSDSDEAPDQLPSDYSHVFYNPLRMLRSTKCSVSLDWFGHLSIPEYKTQQLHIEQEIESDLRPRNPEKLYNSVIQLVNKVSRGSDGLEWHYGDFIEGCTYCFHFWNLPCFGNINSLDDSLNDLSTALFDVEHELCFHEANKIILQIQDYVKQARQQFDRELKQIARFDPDITDKLTDGEILPHHERRVDGNAATGREYKSKKALNRFLIGIQKQADSLLQDYRLGEVKE